MHQSELFDALVDLVLPRDCIGCGQPRHRLCESCIEAAADLAIHVPTPTPVGFPTCVSFGEYAGSLRQAIIAVKEHGRRDLVRPLAALLQDAVDAVRPVIGTPAYVVPIPSTPAAARARGGDHMLRIARALNSTPARLGSDRFARLLPAGPLPIARVLVPPKKAADAVGLGRLERVATRRHAFTVRRDARSLVRGAHLILIDDLVTSGATLTAAAEVLRAGGAESVRAATIAATVRLNGRS
ncbi:putative amidophosphoribosyltransferase [Antricoccus suffuscus]|uniref:Putative amidophosphoribosyltransferase n=1 Tax=Antricoccus suffuscus TaxID=1629062 RepID=A0A2T0ZR47_9ACTN|nr:phosphoribosyltransferase family protein [Antricoccus suffuscus]PRZ38588.1 putative amidophosphoribosyltransferase [Antricoccus suffuscus]